MESHIYGISKAQLCNVLKSVAYFGKKNPGMVVVLQLQLQMLCLIIFPLFSYRLSIIYAKFDEAARSGNMAINEPNGTYYIMPKKIILSLGSSHGTWGDMVLLVLLLVHISFA